MEVQGRIYGQIQEKGHWRRRSNSEICGLYIYLNIVDRINIRTLVWERHSRKTTNKMGGRCPEGCSTDSKNIVRGWRREIWPEKNGGRGVLRALGPRSGCSATHRWMEHENRFTFSIKQIREVKTRSVFSVLYRNRDIDCTTAWTIRGWSPSRSKEFIPPPKVQKGSRAQTVSYSTGTNVLSGG